MERATLNNMRTSFSPSPCHLLVSDDAEMLKKVALASLASACTPTTLLTDIHSPTEHSPPPPFVIALLQ